jgi:hypothetical protein
MEPPFYTCLGQSIINHKTNCYASTSGTGTKHFSFKRGAQRFYFGLILPCGYALSRHRKKQFNILLNLTKEQMRRGSPGIAPSLYLKT